MARVTSSISTVRGSARVGLQVAPFALTSALNEIAAR